VLTTKQGSAADFCGDTRQRHCPAAAARPRRRDDR